MLYIKTYGPAFNFVPVGCGEVPKLVLGGNNNFQGTFLPTLFFGQKHPRLIYPRYSTITSFCPQNGLCTAHIIARGRAAGCGAVQHANETRCNADRAQVQALCRCSYCTAQVIQAQRRCPYRQHAVQRRKICE